MIAVLIKDACSAKAMKKSGFTCLEMTLNGEKYYGFPESDALNEMLNTEFAAVERWRIDSLLF